MFIQKNMNRVGAVPVGHFIASENDAVASEASLKLLCYAIRPAVCELGGYKGAGILEKRETQPGEVVTPW